MWVCLPCCKVFLCCTCFLRSFQVWNNPSVSYWLILDDSWPVCMRRLSQKLWGNVEGYICIPFCHRLLSSNPDPCYSFANDAYLLPQTVLVSISNSVPGWAEFLCVSMSVLVQTVLTVVLSFSSSGGSLWDSCFICPCCISTPVSLVISVLMVYPAPSWVSIACLSPDNSSYGISAQDGTASPCSQQCPRSQGGSVVHSCLVAHCFYWRQLFWSQLNSFLSYSSHFSSHANTFSCSTLVAE